MPQAAKESSATNFFPAINVASLKVAVPSDKTLPTPNQLAQ